MMTGLGFLQFFSYYLKKTHRPPNAHPAAIGVGGSMLSIGSAAGVALMGQSRGKYTFFGHMKWTPVIILGYAASIMVHMWINAGTFSVPITAG